MLCFHIYEWKENTRVTQDSSEPDLKLVYNRFLDEARPHFQYFWNHLPEPEQNILKLVGNNQSQSIQAKDWYIIQNLKLKTLITETSNSLELFSEAFKKFIFSQTMPSITQPISETMPGTAEIDRESIISKSAQNAIPVSWGNIYFVDENSPEISVKFYNELTTKGIQGLFITRLPAEKATEQWKLTDSRIIWLCSRSGKDTIPPALEKISHRVYEFVQHNENSIIFLDGLEYIINNNDFLKTLSLLDNIKEIIAINKSVLIFPISSSIFTEKEMTLLGKNAVKIDPEFRLDFSNL
jgi:hypothetical protein